MPETMKPSLRLAATIATAVLTAGCAVAGISESTARSSAPVVTETTAAGDAVADETEESKPRAKPKPKPRPRPRQRSFPVARVVDGDTVELGYGQQVRVAGIDTPERGECGYEAASNHMADLVLFERVILTISDEGSSSPSP